MDWGAAPSCVSIECPTLPTAGCLETSRLPPIGKWLDAHDERLLECPADDLPQHPPAVDDVSDRRRGMLPGGAHLEVSVREADLVETTGHGRDMPPRWDTKTSSSSRNEAAAQSPGSLPTLGRVRRVSSVVPWLTADFLVGQLRHIADSQSHRDDASVDADLADQPADERRAQFVEARPITSCHGDSDRIADHLAQHCDLDGTALDCLCCDLVGCENEILCRRPGNPEAGKPARQGGPKTRKFGCPTFDDGRQATTVFQRRIHLLDRKST